MVVGDTAKAKTVTANQSTTSVAANTPTAIKIAFAKKAKKKIKAAIRKKGPRQITVTATATDKFGNVSTDTVKFKLKG